MGGWEGEVRWEHAVLRRGARRGGKYLSFFPVLFVPLSLHFQSLSFIPFLLGFGLYICCIVEIRAPPPFDYSFK